MATEAEIERIRSMTLSERLRLQVDLMNLAWTFLRQLPVEEAQRRLDLSREPWGPPPQPPPPPEREQA